MLELEDEVKSLKEFRDAIVCYIDPEELKAIDHLKSITPSNAKLRLLASENPPADEWLDDDE